MCFAPLTDEELKDWGLSRMILLLDTCAFIWLTQESAKLSAAAWSAIDDPANTLAFSHASAWEMYLKHHAGKLNLPDPPKSRRIGAICSQDWQKNTPLAEEA